MRLIDAEGSELQTQLKIIREAEYQIYGSGSWGFTAKCERAIEDAPTVQPEPHWIPVTENTLPEKNRVVVVYGNKGTWDFGTYRGHGDNIHFWHWKKNTYKHVYWWMYKEDALPEPYKEVAK